MTLCWRDITRQEAGDPPRRWSIAEFAGGEVEQGEGGAPGEEEVSNHIGPLKGWIHTSMLSGELPCCLVVPCCVETLDNGKAVTG